MSAKRNCLTTPPGRYGKEICTCISNVSHQCIHLDCLSAIVISVRASLSLTFPMFLTSIYSITDLESNDSKEILHYHYTTWPDFGVPQCPTAFLRFLADVRQSGALDQNVGPPIVHCSAGIGRSGTFCLVDTCLVVVSITLVSYPADLPRTKPSLKRSSFV